MDWAIEGFKRLASTTSTKEKEAILKEYKDLKADCFEELLKANLDPYKLYYITKLPEIPKLEGEPSCPVLAYYDFLNLLDTLSTRKVTGNAAKEEVIKLFSRLDQGCLELFTKILLKKSIGVGVKTVNKVYGKDFIPEFKVMLAPSKNADIMHLEYPVMIQPKLDGARAIYIPNDQGEINLWSRAGKPFRNINLKSHFSNLSKVGEYTLDGELYHHDISFQQLMSILSSEDAQIPTGLKFVVYDCIPIEDWHAQECNLDYDVRLRRLREIVTGQIADFTKIIDIKNDEVDSASEIKDLYKQYLLDKYEGIMIKSTRGKYQWKRVTEKSGTMLKLKPFKSEDLEVVSIYAGEGKFEGVAGGVVVNFNNNSVSVGTGFNDSTRKEMAEQSDKFIGKVAEIKYFEETKDGSLRFPVFARWRDDK